MLNFQVRRDGDYLVLGVGQTATTESCLLFCLSDLFYFSFLYDRTTVWDYWRLSTWCVSDRCQKLGPPKDRIKNVLVSLSTAVRDYWRLFYRVPYKSEKKGVRNWDHQKDRIKGCGIIVLVISCWGLVAELCFKLLFMLE
ncbi:hypothetical protein CEXT_570831 [Caerostris extrusa]|uniref:Uncharacterized protein n=1 Tax=Caerostris extrusa TaxID=172846 RepID=A0AAV4MSH7_CAEEX|nr:hypothetical protein CEXT_570831 [Caerostris extrusa]